MEGSKLKTKGMMLKVRYNERKKKLLLKREKDEKR